MKTAYWMRLFKKISFSLLLAASLTACEFSSKEELIEAYGRTMGKDGYMTKDDYVIKWPAVHRGDVVAPPLTLKIPKKWLRVTPSADSAYSKDREDGTIGSIYVMSSVPGPTPWIEPLPWPKKIPYADMFKLLITHPKNWPPRSKEELEKRAIYAKAVRNRVSIGIFRGTSSISGLFRGEREFHLRNYYESPCSGLAVGEYHVIASERGCLREPDIDGLESYVKLICYSDDQLNGVYQQKFYKDNLQRKAADDNSPDNCYANRGYQSLKTPPNTPESKQVIINCYYGSCWAYFSFYKRRVEVYVERGLNDAYNKINHYPKNPMRNEVYTELARWREKVDVARKLVNSFVVEQPKT